MKRLFFEKNEGNWVDIIATITKQYNNWVHSSTTLTPIQGILKKNEGYVYKNLLDKCTKKTKISGKRSCSSCRLKKNVFKRRYNKLVFEIIQNYNQYKGYDSELSH